MVKELQESGFKGDSLLRAAFERVKEMKFNGEERLLVSKSGLCSKLKLGSGNSADVNLALIQVLKKLGFKTYPIVLSTRDNGIISQHSPSLNKLNYVIVAIHDENGLRLLDPPKSICHVQFCPTDALMVTGGWCIPKNRTGYLWLSMVKMT